MEQEESSMGMTVSGIIGTSNPNDLPVTYKMQSWIMLCMYKCRHVYNLAGEKAGMHTCVCTFIAPCYVVAMFIVVVYIQARALGSGLYLDTAQVMTLLSP